MQDANGKKVEFKHPFTETGETWRKSPRSFYTENKKEGVMRKYRLMRRKKCGV